MTCGAPYETLATVNASTDVTNLLVYANELTCGYLSPLILLGFWCVVCFGSYFMQVRFTGFGQFRNSFVVASFLTFGLSVLFLAKDGLLNITYFYLILGLNIISALWLYWSSDEY